MTNDHRAPSAVLMAGQDFEYAAPTSIDDIVRALVVPVGLGVVLLLAVTAYLGTWQQIFVDRVPLRRWVGWIVVALLITVVAITNYSGLGEKGLAFALLLLIATLMVGFGEELLFRGVGVQAFRNSGFSEFKVGLWTTVLFGVAHGTNIFSAGPSALIQVVLTTATGFVFYLVLRSTGALVMAMAAHGLWDFSVLSTQVNPENPSPLANVAAVVLALILVTVLVLRKRLSPAAS